MNMALADLYAERLATDAQQVHPSLLQQWLLLQFQPLQPNFKKIGNTLRTRNLSLQCICHWLLLSPTLYKNLVEF